MRGLSGVEIVTIPLIWVNVVHAVDGAWGIAGVAMTNAQLSEAVAKG